MTFEHSNHGYSSPRLLPQQLGQPILQRLSSTANARLLTIGLPQQLLCIRQLPLHILVGGIGVHSLLQQIINSNTIDQSFAVLNRASRSTSL